MINNNNLHKIEKSLLEELEQKRVKAEKKSSRYSITVIIISMALFFYNIDGANDLNEIITPLLIIGFIGSIIYAIGNAIITSEYIDKFKLEIIKPLIEGINETFSYKPDRKMPRFIFKRSKLFGMFNKYSGDDFVSGEIDGVKFSLSELSVHDERSSGKNKVVIKIFQGIFCEFDFNKHFSSTLLMYPDVAEKYFGHFGQWLQSINFTKDQLIKLDNPEFEKHFVVYGSDQIEARYLLTYSMMEYILKLREKLNAPIYISFNESKLYIGVDYDGAQQFEPDITASLLDSSYIQNHIEKINYHIEIIENFKLNKFLWSKQPKSESKAQPKQEIQTKIIANLESEESSEELKENINSAQEESKEIEVSKKQVAGKKEIYDEFYKQAAEIMKSLDKQRIRVSIYKAVFTISMISICIMLSIYINDTMYKNVEGITIVSLLTFFAILFGNATIDSNYRDNYKTKLVSTLFGHINSNLLYKPYYRIAQDEVYNAVLFKDWSSFMGDDFIEGKISGLNTTGSELSIEINDSNIFKGYFFIFDLEKYDNLDVRVFPSNSTFDVDDTDQITIFDEDFTKDSKYFKDLFSAYGSNEDAKKILSKEFVSRLLFFYRELRVDKIFTSFKGSKLYIGFDFNGEEFFEAPTSKAVHDEDKILFYIAFFNAVEELIDSI